MASWPACKAMHTFDHYRELPRTQVPFFLAMLSNSVLVWRRTTLSLTLALALLMLGEWRVRALPGERKAPAHNKPCHKHVHSVISCIAGGDFFEFVAKHREDAPKILVAVLTLFLTMKWRFLHSLPITRTIVSLPNLILAFVLPNRRGAAIRARKKVPSMRRGNPPPYMRTRTFTRTRTRTRLGRF